MLKAPEKLSDKHQLNEFSCGEASLDIWLKQRAAKNEEMRASRTYVVCDGCRVVGYYCLAVGSVEHQRAPGKVKRNMPDPIPVMILGRLAIDQNCQGKGIGRALLRDAVLRTLQAAEFAGIRALLVHALNDAARSFYLASGFHQSPIDPMTLMVTLDEIEQSFVAAGA
jgi:GNAT superfamily N-acetyltransferase